jgi:hypothetical protein
MKTNKLQRKIAFTIFCTCMSAYLLEGCKKLAGLPLQENQDHIVTTIDPHLNKTAWQFLKDRGIAGDSIFYQMYQAIVYSGIDTAEYTKTGRTFILLHRDAVLRTVGVVVQPDCYFGKYKVNGLPATSWSQYPPLQVKNYLLSLIVQGEHTFENITPDPEFDHSLMPPGTDTLNPQSLITFRVINDRDSRLRINDFPGSAFPTPGLATPGLQARTAGLLSTNGPVHVIDRVLFYQTQ